MWYTIFFFAVQIHHCPSSSRGLCCRSACGSSPAVLTGQRNPQAAFLNSVPTANAALINQTVKGKRTLEGGRKLQLLWQLRQSWHVVLFTLCILLFVLFCSSWTWFVFITFFPLLLFFNNSFSTPVPSFLVFPPHSCKRPWRQQYWVEFKFVPARVKTTGTKRGILQENCNSVLDFSPFFVL